MPVSIDAKAGSPTWEVGARPGALIRVPCDDTYILTAVRLEYVGPLFGPAEAREEAHYATSFEIRLGNTVILMGPLSQLRLSPYSRWRPPTRAVDIPLLPFSLGTAGLVARTTPASDAPPMRFRFIFRGVMRSAFEGPVRVPFKIGFL